MTEIISLNEDTNLFGDTINAKSRADRDQLAAMLFAQLKDISLEEFAGMFINRFQATMDYVDLCEGNKKTGQRISLLFNPHRLDTGTKRFPISLYKALKDERFMNGLARVIFLNRSKGTISDLLYASIGIGVQGTSFLQEFPPHVARDLALEYDLTKHSHVLDPCAGWGGRMLGFSAVVDHYTCCEPSTRTANGLYQIRGFIQSFRKDFNAMIYERPFEDVSLPDATFDFAFTSPPYFDTEWYAPGEQTNSFNRYATFDAWVEGFYAPLIHRTMRALKPGAAFVINIGSRLYPLNDKLMHIAEGHYAVSKQKGRLLASNGLGKDGEGETFYEILNPAGTIVVVEPSGIIPTEYVGTTILDSEPAATKNQTEESISESLSTEPQPTVSESMSALAFALRHVDAPETVSETSIAFDVISFIAELRSNGHRLLTRDGKLLCTESSQLTDERRATIKAHREELMPYAQPLPRVEVSEPNWPAPAASMAAFLNGDTSSDSSWTAEPPPSLDGIDSLVFNVESNGLEWYNGDRPIGITVGTLDGQMKRFLPFGYRDGNLDESVVKEWALRELRGKHLTGAKIRFDIHNMREWGVDLEAQGNTVSDVQHYAALLDDHRRRFAIDELAKDYLGGVEILRVDERMMASYSAATVAPRAEYQVALTAQLRNAMWPLLDKEDLQEVRQLEDDTIYPVVEMEKNGVLLDMELLDQYHTSCTTRHQALMLEIINEVGFPFEHTPTGWQRLFEKYGLPPSSSYAEKIIGAIDHPVIKKAHFAHQLASLDSKTFAAYKRLVNSDGILRFDINQLQSDDGGTVSGRFSIGYIQQVPNHDYHAEVFGDDLFPRRLFIPASGEYLNADAAQIEFRLFSHFANNAKLLQAYRDDPLMSFHKTTWAMMKQYKADMLYTDQKSFNFAFLYGARSIKLAVMMGYITEAEGDEIRRNKRWDDPRLNTIREIEAAYLRMLPEGVDLINRASHLAKPMCDDFCKQSDVYHREKLPHRGYVKTIVGRRSRFPNTFKTYIGLNRVLQGSGADIMKKKLAILHRERKHTGLLLRATVHDSVLGDAQLPETKQRVGELLNEQSYQLNVPVLWDVGTGVNWAEAK